jgi:hypothetical protein
MCAAEFVCALDVFARHTSSRITFLTLSIVGRSRGDVSFHQDVFQTFVWLSSAHERCWINY